MEPEVVYLHRNRTLLVAVPECRILLRESTVAPTPCRELVTAWPDYVGIKDASGQGVGGVVFGEHKSCTPMVFQYQWPPDITADINSEKNPNGRITNSDLEMAGLLMLWLVMEVVCEVQPGNHAALYSNNQPTVSSVDRLASKSSLVVAMLLWALALRLKM